MANWMRRLSNWMSDLDASLQSRVLMLILVYGCFVRKINAQIKSMIIGSYAQERTQMNLSKTDIKSDERTRTHERVQEPPLYQVLLHNDDYTTMEFVIEILMVIFNRSMEDATRIMLNVHRNGLGICGVYPYEIAETKVEVVEVLARSRDFPLKCSLEKA
jgi:ATP-dependent Clp protease adaptor protein ClpS